MGRFFRDLLGAAITGAIAAVVALQLDATTPQAILIAASTGAIAAVIAVARRKLAGTTQAPGTDTRP